jgi:hypothetical protein
MQSASQFLSEFLNTRATGWLVDFTLASYCAWAMGTENSMMPAAASLVLNELVACFNYLIRISLLLVASRVQRSEHPLA